MALLSLDSISKSYNGLPALRQVSLDVFEGDILAFMGPNGAGKTTAIKIMTGLLRPDSGTVLYNGKPFCPRDSEQKRLLGVVPQNSNLDRDLTAEDNLRIHGMLFGLKGKDLSARMEAVLLAVGLSEYKKQISGKLSGGLQRRLTIARALLHQPRILFLDEPSNGLDPTSRRAIHGLVRRLNKDTGVSVFLTTHAIDEAEALSNRVAFINRGILAAVGDSLAMKAEMGRFALDTMDSNGEFSLAETRYFSLRADAVKAAQQVLATQQEADGPEGAPCANAIIREVTLEDVYARATGSRMATGPDSTGDCTDGAGQGGQRKRGHHA